MKVRHALIASALVTGSLVAGSLVAGVGPAAAAPAGPAAFAGIRTYTMTVKTGDLDNADTDDAVRFAAQGTESWAPSFRVDRDFKRGETVTFSSKQWESLGTVTSVTVQKSKQEKDAWYLEYVQVHDESMGRVYVCPANIWFEQNDDTQHRFACA
ncbi:PLAT/LH2 domain-containing protein [Pseudosporangium ferrugineum]|uniref:PLAT/LH2 domain-containing protein n=1 Tax=Pseudosporangium ferrugineum TaxID=439699 RepID=A0A2T0RHG8_9ACTN|nr:PLAT/LH2 domain-containing protein [Pseudosporangium ferrugineum]PRY20550.1 PLAT/LH2 domain-containing protein [Pseudosporangium ferrugineum]